MSRQPYEMTSTEFSATFPYFIQLTPKQRWRLYRINNKTNLQETGEKCSYEEFIEFATDGFRWDIEEAMVLVESEHRYFVGEALRRGYDVPSDVLDEYPDIAEEFIKKCVKAERLQQRRLSQRHEEKFWKQFK